MKVAFNVYTLDGVDDACMITWVGKEKQRPDAALFFRAAEAVLGGPVDSRDKERIRRYIYADHYRLTGEVRIYRNFHKKL